MHDILKFRDEKLLRQALTHRSYANENPGETHNERLEFLGDSILTFVCGEYLYRNYPEFAEDEMTRRRAALVDEKQLAKFAIEVGLEFRMRLGKGLCQYSKWPCEHPPFVRILHVSRTYSMSSYSGSFSNQIFPSLISKSS